MEKNQDNPDKSTVISTVLETPLGALMVQTKHEPGDHYHEEDGELKFISGWKNAIEELKARIDKATDQRLLNRSKSLCEILENGRYRVPGEIPEPRSDEFKFALEITGNKNMPALNSPESINFVRAYIAATININLGLDIDESSVVPVLKDQGFATNHLYYLARAHGRIHLDPDFHGIGFLEIPTALPLTHFTVSPSTIRFYEKYIQSPLRAQQAGQYLSTLSVSPNLVDEWYMTMLRAYQLRVSPMGKKNPQPVYPVSSEHFRIE